MYFQYLQFLITYDFWSRIGFLISYTITFLLVLEVLRLIYTDVNKREVEKLFDTYTRSRTSTSPAARGGARKKIAIDDLHKRPSPMTPERRRTRSPAVTPDSEQTLVDEERRRRALSRAEMHQVYGAANVSVTATAGTAAHTSPTRRLRKRSDTLTSAASAETKKLDRERRRREASPASAAGSKASSSSSSRHASPSARKMKDREAQQLSSSLHKLLQRSR